MTCGSALLYPVAGGQESGQSAAAAVTAACRLGMFYVKEGFQPLKRKSWMTWPVTSLDPRSLSPAATTAALQNGWPWTGLRSVDVRGGHHGCHLLTFKCFVLILSLLPSLFPDLLLQCTPSCGPGYRHRVVLCKSGESGEALPESKCAKQGRPTSRVRCNLKRCPPPQWVTGPWGEVSPFLPVVSVPTAVKIGTCVFRCYFLCVAVFCQMWTGPGDAFCSVSGPHWTTVQWVYGPSATCSHAAVQEQMWPQSAHQHGQPWRSEVTERLCLFVSCVKKFMKYCWKIKFSNKKEIN